MPHNTLNITNCEREPVRIVGKIQRYGFLIAADSQTGLVKYASLNINVFLPLDSMALLGKPLNSLDSYIGFPGRISSFDFCKKSFAENVDFARASKVDIAGQPFHLVISQIEELLVLEFQPAVQTPEITPGVFNVASKILASKTLEGLYNNAADEIKNLIDYDRVMVYKFLPDGSGLVVGEAINKNMEPFMGQSYPESDITRQAVELYKSNRMRLIADVGGETVDVVGQSGSRPFDMSYCSLLAASPLHILYCENMGFGSSFSISIIIDDELWGLITCYNTKAKHIDYRVRQGVMFLGTVISTAIVNKIDEAGKKLEIDFQKEVSQLQHHLSFHESLLAGLTKSDTSLKNVTNADGVAVIYQNEIFLVGCTPEKEQVKDLAKWARNVLADHIFLTDELSKHYSQAESFSDKASGILVTSLGNENRDLIIWFKPEKVKNILWAEQPKKAQIETETAGVGLRTIPGAPFKVWRETISKTSAEWLNEELFAAQKTTQIIRDFAFRKAEEQIAIDKMLKEAYEELDRFTNSVSHDLKNPLGVIKTYAQFLVHSNVVTDEKGKDIVNKIVSSSDKITDILQSLLELSKISRQEKSALQQKL